MVGQQQQQSKFALAHALKAILLQRNPGYKSESGYHQMRVDGRIQSEYVRCG